MADILELKLRDWIPGIGMYTFVKRVMNDPKIDDMTVGDFDKELNKKISPISVYGLYQLAATSFVASTTLLSCIYLGCKIADKLK